MFAYKGSTAMITGASKGLGAAFAKELAGRCMNLVLIARSIDTLQDLADSLGAQYGVSCVALRADLAASDAVERIVTELERLDLKIDLLINNAGLGLTGDFLSHDLAQELASIQVNVQALVGLSHALGAKMVSRGTGGIINLASNAAFQPLPHMATYAAAKAFVLHFSEALKFELKGRGVQVMAVCPGPTATSFFEGVSTKMKDGAFDAPSWWSAAPCGRSIRKSPSPILDGSACAPPFGFLVRCPATLWLALINRTQDDRSCFGERASCRPSSIRDGPHGSDALSWPDGARLAGGLR
jgi:short-subunit dehydrogenase